MKVLVTGATGFLGSNLLSAAASSRSLTSPLTPEMPSSPPSSDSALLASAVESPSRSIA